MPRSKTPVRVLLGAVAVVLVGGPTVWLRSSRHGDAPRFPDLIVQVTHHAGALGKLRFDPQRQAYTLVDGRFVSLIVEPASIRTMRIGEGGGAMAIPSAATSVGGHMIGFVPAFNSLVALDAGLNLVKQVSYGRFQLEGTFRKKSIEAWRGNLYLFSDNTLVSYDDNLDKLGELAIDRFGWAPRDFVIQDGTLYSLDSPAAGPHVECPVGGRLRGRCPGSPEVSITLVDVSNPRALKLLRDERVATSAPAFDNEFKALDPAGQAWVVPSLWRDKQRLQLRTLAAPGDVTADVELPGTVVAMTERAPIYAVVESERKLSLIAIQTTPTTIAIAGQRALDLPPGRVGLRSDPRHVFVASGARLLVFRADATMTPELDQVVTAADHTAAEIVGVFPGE